MTFKEAALLSRSVEEMTFKEAENALRIKKQKELEDLTFKEAENALRIKKQKEMTSPIARPWCFLTAMITPRKQGQTPGRGAFGRP